MPRGRITKAAVLGAGVMGSQIAAHLANAGVEVVLLDIVPPSLTEEERARGLTLESPEVRNRFARLGLERAKQLKPPAFMDPDRARLITVGNLEDDLPKLATADWIIEAVVEDLEVKRALFRRVEAYRRPDAIVSSNTSGIPIARLQEGLSVEFRRHFLGTHFFNPPRYMRLVEVIPTPETAPEVVRTIADFCDRALGKGVVFAKDTPNFIANRIGVFSFLRTLRAMLDYELTLEEVDALTGPAIGHPKSATFRTADLAGLDVLARVVENIAANAPEDEWREVFVLPDFVREMIRRGWIGEKAGCGFYRRDPTTGEILALDYRTLEYRPRQKARFPALDMARPIEDVRERLRTLLQGTDRAGRFLWTIVSETLRYAAHCLPEIADDLVQVDRAMRWGFNWELGPFETWDALGVRAVAERLQQEGRAIPPVVQALLASGNETFYREEAGRRFYFDPADARYREEEQPPGLVLLSALKAQHRLIRSNPGASLIDLGDGVACVEFHSKMNTIGADTVQMLQYALERLAEGEFEGLVIGNQGEHFSAGANLMLLLLAAEEEEWDELDLMIRAFQRTNLTLKYAARPVVVAPFGLTLGGGCEITLHAPKVRAAAETYIGLVETSVGLIPAGGGTKELLLRMLERAPRGDTVDLFPYVRQAFETIALAKVSGSAHEAKRMGLLRPSDAITMNRDRLIADAKATVLALAREGYERPAPPAEIPVLGEPGLAALKLGIHLAWRAGQITEYDAHIGRKLAWVLCGGDLRTPRAVTEDYLLDLEREAFLSLLGEPKTRERIRHMLTEGKPLRN
jgi:3-hydroxyacyl-CoA dehydrogenase